MIAYATITFKPLSLLTAKQFKALDEHYQNIKT